MNNELIGRIDRMLCCYPTKTINKVLQDCKAALAHQQEAEPVFENLMVGNATTLNQDEYPGLGEWWIQLRIGPTHDEVLARVYGNSVSEVRERAAAICNALHPPKPAAQPQVPEGYQLVPVAATMKIENAIAASRNLSSSEIWEDALAAAKEGS